MASPRVTISASTDTDGPYFKIGSTIAKTVFRKGATPAEVPARVRGCLGADEGPAGQHGTEEFLARGSLGRLGRSASITEGTAASRCLTDAPAGRPVAVCWPCFAAPGRRRWAPGSERIRLALRAALVKRSPHGDPRSEGSVVHGAAQAGQLCARRRHPGVLSTPSPMAGCRSSSSIGSGIDASFVF